jgi:hypothetical protein
MAPNEVHALNQFAKKHGTHLTINPKTGLPEAGLLSTLVGGLTAVFAPQLLPYVAGGIGIASYAKTGSLMHGLMEGMGAWTGGSLAQNIQGLAQNSAHLSGEGAKQMVDAAIMPTNATMNTTMGSSLMGANAMNTANTTTGLANLGAANTVASGIPGMFGQTVAPQLAGQGIGSAATSLTPGAASSLFSPETAKSISDFSSGAKQLVSSPIDSVKQIWDMPAGKGLMETSGKSNLIGVGMNVLPAVAGLFQPKAPKKEEEEENPFELKMLSKDFKGYTPTQPNPYYQAQYRDYVANPYVSGAAGGGLQTANYARGDLVQYGLNLLNQPESKPADITPTDPGAKYSPAYNSLGVVEYEEAYKGMSANQKAKAMLSDAKKLGKLASKASVMMPDPAQIAVSSIQNEAPATSAKEGGLMSYGAGGLSMGHLGGYSDGGRLLKGPGDGVSDSIPASIGAKQPARLAEGEFVIPARIVSELGNGSTDAGAKRLYAMMDRIKARRRKTKNIAADSKAYNLLPA